MLRRTVPWEDWAVTTRVDAQAHWQAVWQAIQCHQTQWPSLPSLQTIQPERLRRLLGDQTFYRAVGAVHGGRAVETDLFEGLR